MKIPYPVPSSIAEAGTLLASRVGAPLRNLPTEGFMACWSAIAYLQPGLHPDGYEDEESGWPDDLRPYAAEAWSRNEAGELSDDELYCSYATWAGLYDQMSSHNEEERALRAWIAAGAKA